jgi:hypothetical protein
VDADQPGAAPESDFAAVGYACRASEGPGKVDRLARQVAVELREAIACFRRVAQLEAVRRL